jgi:hypothetical protein
MATNEAVVIDDDTEDEYDLGEAFWNMFNEEEDAVEDGDDDVEIIEPVKEEAGHQGAEAAVDDDTELAEEAERIRWG